MVHDMCFCCNRILEAEPTENPMVIPPVYSGIVFRSTGNFGSAIFDPMPIGGEEMLQIVICDECIKWKVKWVTRIHNIKRDVTADIEPFEID